MTTAGGTIEAARDALYAGDAGGAVAILRALCRTTGVHEAPRVLSEAMGVLATLAPQLQDRELGRLAISVWESPSDVQALNKLGCALNDRELFDMACAVLARANELAPSRASILSELAVALEADGRSDLAVSVLEDSIDVLDSSFLCRYLLAYCAVMAGRLPTARAMAAVQLPEDCAEGRMAGNVHRMIARADLAQDVSPLDDDDLRGWHFVTTGGILLHLSPFDFDEGMRGRYAHTSDSYQRIRFCITRLRGALAALECHPARVMAPDDPASLAVAMAVARLLRMPLTALDEGPGLVVVYELARLKEEALLRVAETNPGQLLYAHLTCWTEPSFAPDITGLLCQTNTAPWDDRANPAEPDMPRSRRSGQRGMAGTLADRVLAAEHPWDAPIDARDSDEALRGFCAALRPWFAEHARRERAAMPRGGGPVQSRRL